MSYTYPGRPTVAKTGGGRGRGRGRGTKTQNQHTPNKMQGPGYTTGGGARPRQGDPRGPGDPSVAGETEDGSAGAGLQQQERIQRRDAYHVISPNEKKRAEIARQAKKEEDNYKQYKESKKLNHVSYVGTAGGGEMSEIQARKKLQQKQSSSAHERRMKSQQYKNEQRQRETNEIEQKKAEARRKAEKNKQTEAQRGSRLEVDHRRKNEAFLDRLERERKEKLREKKLAQQERSVQYCHPVQSQYEDEEESEDESETLQGASAADVHPAHSIESTQLRELQIYFPTYDPKYLEDILLQVNGDTDMAKQLLS